MPRRKTVNKRIERSIYTKVLEPQESLYDIVKAKKKKNGGILSHFLIPTNMNLIYWKRGIFGSKVIRYYYPEIYNVKSVGVFNLTLSFDYLGTQQKFEKINRKQINTLVENIKNLVVTARNQLRSSTDPNRAQQDPETIIKLRYAKGEITEQQMNQMLSKVNSPNSSNTPFIICPSCNYPNEVGWKFCAVCGSSAITQSEDNSTDVKQKGYTN